MLSYAMNSHIGCRKSNEDYIVMKEYNGAYLFVLADGLGGHAHGETASQTVAEQAVRTFMESGSDSKTLKNVFKDAQRYLLEKKHFSDGMKSTMAVLQLSDKNIQWGHIGDSRVYYFQNCRLIDRTLDHSVPQELVEAGTIKEEEIRSHPERNKVLRVMGVPWDAKAYELSSPVEWEKNQAFLLCSDGFWELIEEKDMLSALRHAKSPAHWLKMMEETVKENGKDRDMDNYSAICVCID